MIKLGHNGLQISCRKACWKRYDDVDAPKWNFEVKPFVVRWIVQTKEDMHELGAIRDHMLAWSVTRMGRWYCRLVLTLQEGKDVDQP